MIQSHSIIKTQSGSKYLQQLSKHWAHKIEGLTFDPQKAYIPFSEEVLIELFAREGELEVRVRAPDEETLVDYEGVFVRHIERFAFRETLEISWQRQAALQ